MSDVVTRLADKLAHVSVFVRVSEQYGLAHAINLDELEAECLAALDEVRGYYSAGPEPVDDEYDDPTFLETEEEFAFTDEDNA